MSAPALAAGRVAAHSRQRRAGVGPRVSHPPSPAHGWLGRQAAAPSTRRMRPLPPRPTAHAGPDAASLSSPAVRFFRPAGSTEADDTGHPSSTRPVLLFLPGTDGTSHGLDTQAGRLAAAGWEVWAAAYDGGTAWGWADAVADVRAAVARLGRGEGGARRVLLVGESFGAAMALRVAAGACPALGGLALINPATAFPRALGGAPALLARSGLLGAAPDGVYSLAQRILLPLLVDRGRTGPAGGAAAAAMMGMRAARGDDDGAGGNGLRPSRPAAAASHRLRLMVDGAGLDDGSLARIAVPTLLIASAADSLLPSLSETARLAALIPGAGAQQKPARLVLPESGHAPLLEAGVSLADLLEEGGLSPAALLAGAQESSTSTAPPALLPPWAAPDPAVDAAWEALAPARALVSPRLVGEDRLPSPSSSSSTLPPRPLLFVANHARYGLYDLPFLVGELYARGVRVRGVAHPAHWRGPLGPEFERLGAIKSSPRALLKALSAKEACLLFPGGGREVNKPAGADHTLFWRDAPDLVRIAERTGALIIPVASVGADDAYTVLADTEAILANPIAGPAVRAALGALLPGAGLDPEESVFPISALPLPGLPPILPAPIPIPRPTRLYFEVCEPIDATAAVAAAGGGLEGAKAVYADVRSALEAGIARQLAAREADADGLRSLSARVDRVRRRWLG
jgi:pimeloyl-ACP methyl ester carboxylesterase/1-acyl-sn-glycerol-3-phosphate acyltransferase